MNPMMPLENSTLGLKKPEARSRSSPTVLRRSKLGAKKASRVKGLARPAIPATELPLAPGVHRYCTCMTVRTARAAAVNR
jgi:hypothetical protein